MENFIRQYNDEYSYPNFVYKETTQAHNVLYEGLITDVREQNRIGCIYDVRLLDWDIVIRGCKLSSSFSGYSGRGNYYPLEEGTPVTLLCKEGYLPDAIIIGTHYNEGNYEKFYGKGQLQKPGELEEGYLFNQPSPYPSRITQTRATTLLYGASDILEPYNSPEFYQRNAIDKQSAAHGYPGVVHAVSPYKYEFNYSLGSQIYYSDGNIISISVGAKDTKTTVTTRIANTHAAHADLLEGKAKANQNKNINTEGLTAYIDRNNISYNLTATDEYRAEQHRKLAGVYQSAGQELNSTSAARYEKAKEIQSQLGTELAIPQTAAANGTTTAGGITSSNSNLDGKQVASSYSPAQSRAYVDSSNYGQRLSVDNNDRPLNQKPLVVLHETVCDLKCTLDTMARPESNASYHALIKYDGSIVYLTPPNLRAFGAGDSSFNGETASVSDSNNPPSVNNFAYHITLLTPPDGNNEANSHSGYTEEQYKSLAWLTARTRVENDRITTHKEVDNSGTREDPRSFDWGKFNRYLNQFPSSQLSPIDLGIGTN